MKFNEIIENEQLLKAIEKMGFESPSPIQEKVIPLIKENIDVIGHAKTGTGKTAAFALPILEHLSFDKKEIQVLVLVPTRELAKQVNDEIQRLASYMKKVKSCVIYGGQSYTKQRDELKRNPQIVVATPGRLIDLLDRKYLKINNLDYLVLDEADEMLSVGFAQELEKIAKYCNDERHTLLFSATFNDKVLKLSKTYLKDPQKVSVVSKDKVATTIEQKYLLANKPQQVQALEKLLVLHHNQRIMVFANTKKEVDSIVEQLQSNGVMAEGIHGDLNQKMRENVLAKFRKGIIQVLVCSDVAARGLDIKGVDVIINMELPFEQEYYVHRVGRTGRANQEGIAYTIITPRKERQIKQLANSLKTTITKLDSVSNKDIQLMKDKITVDNLEEAILNPQDNMEKIHSLLKKGYDLDSIFHGLLTLVFGQDTSLNNEVDIKISVGKKDRFSKGDLIRWLQLSRDELYEIRVRNQFTTFTLNTEDNEKYLKKLEKKKFNKKPIKVTVENK